MRKYTGILTAVLVFCICGCIVLSVHPPYAPDDIVFDPALIGHWGEEGEVGGLTIEEKGATGYRLTSQAVGPPGKFDAYLFQLEEQVYLDLYPQATEQELEETWMMHMFPMHSLYRVDQIGPELILAPLDYEWIEKFLKEHPDKLEHTFTGDYLLITAPTEQYREFLLGISDNHEAFGEPVVMKRLD